MDYMTRLQDIAVLYQHHCDKGTLTYELWSGWVREVQRTYPPDGSEFLMNDAPDEWITRFTHDTAHANVLSTRTGSS